MRKPVPKHGVEHMDHNGNWRPIGAGFEPRGTLSSLKCLKGVAKDRQRSAVEFIARDREFRITLSLLGDSEPQARIRDARSSS
jgi:hypothetical protein